jgi:oligoribonuclease NrnB/cAMP/cGMP phosphodiesterase (DHH superfamily)
MKCFYHNDLDGHASAFCVHAWVGVKQLAHKVEFIEITYGRQFPFESIEKDEQIWIVDYSVSTDEMRRLLSITKDVTWIDHHKTAIEKYSDFEFPIRGIRKDGEAACVLTWKYIHWWTERGDGAENFEIEKEDILPVPRCIELVGDRDVWKWAHGEETRNFFNGSQLHNTQPGSDFWWKCMDHEIKDLPLPNTGNRDARIKGEKFWNELLESGKIIEKYKKHSDGEVNKSLGYEVEFEGYKCFAINRARISSERLGENMFNFDIGMPYYHDGNKFTVSLYTAKDIDCSDIAKKYGGGGHKKAAGFQCVELPFVKK